jgi:hypothetical protein
MGEAVQLVGNCRRIDGTDNVLNASQAASPAKYFLIAVQYDVPILSQSGFAIYRKLGLKFSIAEFPAVRRHIHIREQQSLVDKNLGLRQTLFSF